MQTVSWDAQLGFMAQHVSLSSEVRSIVEQAEPNSMFFPLPTHHSNARVSHHLTSAITIAGLKSEWLRSERRHATMKMTAHTPAVTGSQSKAYRLRRWPASCCAAVAVLPGHNYQELSSGKK